MHAETLEKRPGNFNICKFTRRQQRSYHTRAAPTKMPHRVPRLGRSQESDVANTGPPFCTWQAQV